MTTAPGTARRPLTDLFPALPSRGEALPLRLGGEQVRSFEENGYLAGVRVLEGRALEAVRDAVERIRRGVARGEVVEGEHFPVVLDLAAPA